MILLQKKLDLNIAALHINHLLRGAESDGDETWVREFCRELNIPLQVQRIDAQAFATEHGWGIEEGARRLRYELLEQFATEQGASLIALAHHADDQVETVLHHFLRGTGLRGLTGMKSRRELRDRLWIVRPLLEIRRTELEEALREWKQDSREDSTNRETHYTRNRLRNELLPLLEKEFNPQAAEAILSLSRQAKESQDLIQQLAESLLETQLLERTAEFCRLSKPEFKDQPRHLIREAFVQLWRLQNWPRQQMNYLQWDRLAGIALGESEGGTFPGPIEVSRVRKEVHLRSSML
ncbi:MAG: tRNA lysidine(34) synthetase TilS [Planctomycetaceae bacterium]